MQNSIIIGMPWYTSEDYSAILMIMADSDQLPDTFDEWRLKAEKGEQKLTRSGHIVVRVRIDPETFPDWCRSRGLNIDADARTQYAGIVAKAQHGGTH